MPQKICDFVAKIRLWVQTALTRLCMTLWNRKRMEQFSFLMISSRMPLPIRRPYIGLHGFDYDTLYPNALNIVPSISIIEQWKADYENMRLHMLYGAA